MTRGHAAGMHGGPNTMMHLLLKEYQQISTKEFTLSAVFCDKILRSYEELIPILESLDQLKGHPFRQKIIRKLFPQGFRSAVGAILESLGFIFHLERATKGKGHAPMLFHCHDFVTAYLCSLRYRKRYPIILTVHFRGGWVRDTLAANPVFRGTIIEKLLRHIENTAVQRADIVVFTSKGSLELFEDEHKGLLRGKDVRVIYAGVDTQDLDSATADNELLKKYGLREGASVVLCVAGLIEDKGVDTLIEAIAALPDDVRSKLSCLIRGQGYLKEELQSLIAERGLQGRVMLLDLLPRDELLGLMKAATLFVLPSRVSVFDYVLLEVGAMGLPVVTTAVGGNLEMFDEDSAILVPPDDPQALASAILRLLTDEGLRKRLTENAYQRIRSRFSLENLLNSYSAIYEETLSGK